MPTIDFWVQASPSSPGSSWMELARKIEDLGFFALCVSDHPGNTASPFVALAAAAASTQTLRLGTYVLNMGAHHPLHVAGDVATLDLVSNGRAILGVGAGHTPSEWTMFGRAYPSPAERVAQMKEALDATQRLLSGEVVTFEGGSLQLNQARLDSPRPTKDSIPLLVGGNNPETLRFAAERADIVAISGLGRTLPGGHLHEMLWGIEDFEKRLDLIDRAARAARRNPTLNLLVYHVEDTSNRSEAADGVVAQLKKMLPKESRVPSARELLETPFLLIGTAEEMMQQLIAQQERWGISSYTFRADAMDIVARLIERLG
jgi:probable F420-dependent oxidoreductase